MIDTFDLKNLVEPTLQWFYENKRDLPWRQNKNPYGIWVSEIMLQQTRVEAVIPYYHRFMEALPDIEALAMCPEDRLLKLWEGLGYYNRVRNMQKAARVMVEKYQGQIPQTYDEILLLPGIGPYTAGAIASIAFGEKVPAVDGNVLRILSRVTEDDRDILKDSTKKIVMSSLQEVMPEAAGDFNQGLMEIGALVCIPNGEPKCAQCPWEKMCRAKANGTYDKLPVKKKVKARRIEEKTVLIIRDGQKILLGKRPDKGLLAGLYELPSLKGHQKEKFILDFTKRQGLMPLYIKPLPEAKHIFSHIEWHMKGYMVQVADVESYHVTKDEAMTSEYLLVELEQVQREYAIPSAFEKYTKFVNLKLGPKKTLSKNQQKSV